MSKRLAITLPDDVEEFVVVSRRGQTVTVHLEDDSQASAALRLLRNAVTMLRDSGAYREPVWRKEISNADAGTIYLGPEWT